MIMLTKLNNESFVLNDQQIQMIEMIPETKIVLMNREFFLVRESAQEVIAMIVSYQARIFAESGVVLIKREVEKGEEHGA